MALNKTILIKLKQKTESRPELAAFLQELLEFESDSPGWYKNGYSDILEKTCKEEKKHEDNQNRNN